MESPAKKECCDSLYQCDVTETVRLTEDLRVIKVYGLSLYNRKPWLAGRSGESCRIDDISEDRCQVQHLKELIDEEGLYPVHLRDVIEDYLS